MRHALDDLEKQLTDLVDLTKQVEQQVPPREGKPIINSVSVAQSGGFPDTVTVNITIDGDQFDSAAEVEIFSTATAGLSLNVGFVNSQEIQVSFDLHGRSDLEIGSHDIVVTNPNGQSARFQDAFIWDGATVARGSTAGSGGTSRRRGAAARGRATEVWVHGQTVPPSSGSPAPTPTSAPGVDQQVRDLQNKYGELEKGLADLKASQSALAQKVDEVQKNIQDALANHVTEAKKNQESFMDEIKGLFKKPKKDD